MRGIFRRYTQLSVSQKRVYSLLTLLTLIALLLYCLGLGGVLLRSRLVTDVALELPPTFTATPTTAATVAATAGPTGTPTATLPPTPTQRPIPTLTPTPESVNITVIITSTEGVTSTVVISATVTPTPELTPTVTITAEASLGTSYLGDGMVPEPGVGISAVVDSAAEGCNLAVWHDEAPDRTGLHPAAPEQTSFAPGRVGGARWAAIRRQTPVQSNRYG